MFLYITGGTLIGNGDAAAYQYDGNGCNPTGDALVIDSCNYPSGIESVSISGGTFTSTNGNAVASFTAEGGTLVTGFITGGTFNTDPSDYLAEGYQAVQNQEGEWTLNAPAAQIGTKKYASLAAAIAAVQDGETITMLRDVEAASGISVPSGKNFTVDFASHTYSVEKPGAGSTGTTTQAFQLLENSTITFQNGTIKCTEANKDFTWATDATVKGVAMMIQNYADLTLDNMTIDGTNIAHNGSNVRYIISNNNGSATIKNSTIIAPAGDFAFDSCKYYTNRPTVTVENSTITGKVEATGGNIVLKAGTTVNGQLRIGENKNGGATGSVVTLENGATINNAGNYAIVVFGANTLNVSGTVNGIIGTNGQAYNAGSVINICDGAAVTENTDVAIYMPNGELNISGGTITGKTAVYFKSTKLNITGGTLIGNGDAAAYQYDGNGCNPTGDALVIDSCNYPSGIESVSISGGTFTSTNGNAVASFTAEGGTLVTGFITGGTFNKDPSAYLAADKYAVKNEGLFTVTDTAPTAEDAEVSVSGNTISDTLAETVSEVTVTNNENISVTLDKETMEAANEKSEDGAITITATLVKNTNEGLTAEQQEAIGEDDVIVKLEMLKGTEKVTNFGEGTVTVKIPYNGSNPETKNVFFIDENGNRTKMNATYANGFFTFETSHFSFYAVQKDVNYTVETVVNGLTANTINATQLTGDKMGDATTFTADVYVKSDDAADTFGSFSFEVDYNEDLLTLTEVDSEFDVTTKGNKVAFTALGQNASTAVTADGYKIATLTFTFNGYQAVDTTDAITVGVKDVLLTKTSVDSGLGGTLEDQAINPSVVNNTVSVTNQLPATKNGEAIVVTYKEDYKFTTAKVLHEGDPQVKDALGGDIAGALSGSDGSYTVAGDKLQPNMSITYNAMTDMFSVICDASEDPMYITKNDVTYVLLKLESANLNDDTYALEGYEDAMIYYVQGEKGYYVAMVKYDDVKGTETAFDFSAIANKLYIKKDTATKTLSGTRGDVSGDGKVNVIDTLPVNAAILDAAGSYTITTEMYLKCDVNGTGSASVYGTGDIGNGTIEIGDITWILEEYVGSHEN